MINICDAYTLLFGWLIGQIRKVLGLIIVGESEELEASSFTTAVE